MAAVAPDDADRLASALIAEFRSLAIVVAQTREALLRTVGMPHAGVADLILQARDLLTEAMRTDLQGVRIDPFDPKLRQYLIASMGSLPSETLRIFFLDGLGRLIADEQLQQGSLAQLALYPRTLFRRALEHNAASVILAHNHPSGDPTPSSDDIRVTQILEQIGRALDVRIIDHMIVTDAQIHHVTSEALIGGLPAAVPSFTLGSRSEQDEEGKARALANARATMRRRLLRQQLIGSTDLFGEPAWDMLIDLFIHECEGRALSLSSLCVQASIPWSSALRLIQKLCEAGIMRRVPDPADGRRSFMHLEPATSHRLHAYFTEFEDQHP